MGITKDELTLRLDRVNGWINNCDQKSSILLAIEGVVLTILCTSDYISFIHQQLIFPIFKNRSPPTPVTRLKKAAPACRNSKPNSTAANRI